jgi:integrase
MPYVKLDPKHVVAKKTPEPKERGTRLLYWDTGSDIPMFGVRVVRDPSGKVRRSWIVSYRNAEGVKRLATLGTVSKAFTLSMAREKALGVLAQAQLGKDPVAEARAAREQVRASEFTVEKLAEAFIARGSSVKSRRRGRPWAERTRAEFDRIMRVYVVPAIGDLEASAVPSERIVAMLRDIKAPTMRNRVRAVLMVAYKWAQRDAETARFITPLNTPTFPDQMTDDPRRERVLSEDEIRHLWAATEATRARSGGAFRLLLLTAQRANECFGMRPADVAEESDGSWWQHPTKGGAIVRTPLSKQAVAVLDQVESSRSWTFPSPTMKGARVTSWAKVWAKLGMGDAVPHDLRRTAASLLARSGVPSEHISRVLGHAKSGVTETTYIRHSYEPEVREALAKLGETVDHILTRKAKVVAHRRR